jgi:hypothetical protein
VRRELMKRRNRSCVFSVVDREVPDFVPDPP